MVYPVLPLTIKNLINKAALNQLILPALQREYVWKPKDICKLFDSLMLGYPINTMMFWNVSNISSQPISFYQFLSPNHVEGATNTIFSTSACLPTQTFDVVIDGQQRITSLLIGFAGSYQSAKARTSSQLYLRLDTSYTHPELTYDFQFLNPNKLSANQKNGEVWFRVGDVLSPGFNPIGELNKLGLISNPYAQTCLNTLSNLLNDNDVIHYYSISGAAIDDVLEVFVRTNSGGHALKKGELLMSALTVNWANAGYPVNARDYVDDIIADADQRGYRIDKDWVFNAFLMFTGAPIGLKVSSFMTGNVAATVNHDNVEIRESIAKAFDLVAAFHLQEKGLTTKLAVLPIAYFIFKMHLAKAAILPTNSMKQIYEGMRKFLFRAILQSLFDAGTDEVIRKLRDVLDQKSTKTAFPYTDIVSAFPKLKLTTSDVQGHLQTAKANAFPVLNIIYALGYDLGLTTSCPVANMDYDVDHMHPKKSFEPANLENIAFTTPADQTLANDGVTFDTLPNLELLDAATNRSKNKQPLATWLQNAVPAQKAKLPKDHFFDTLPTGLADFSSFIQKRRQLMENVLMHL